METIRRGEKRVSKEMERNQEKENHLPSHFLSTSSPSLNTPYSLTFCFQLIYTYRAEPLSTFDACSTATLESSIPGTFKKLETMRTPTFGQWAFFRKEARQQLPTRVIESVAKANSLDHALHKEAQRLMEQGVEEIKAKGLWQEPPQVTRQKKEVDASTPGSLFIDVVNKSQR